MLYKPSKDLTLVIYQDQKATKCFEVNKRQLKAVVFIIPVLLTSSLIVILFLYSYFKNITEEIRQLAPRSMQDLRKEHQKLVVKYEKLNREHLELNEKWNTTLNNASMGTGTSTEINKIKNENEIEKEGSNGPIQFFNFPQNAKNLTSSDFMSIDQIKIHQEGNIIRLSFFLNNQMKDLNNKLNGQLFVILKNHSQLSFYPAPSFRWENKIDQLAKLEEGESFNFSKMRSVQAEFRNIIPSSKELEFVILAFAKNGDLLLNKTVKMNLP